MLELYDVAKPCCSSLGLGAPLHAPLGALCTVVVCGWWCAVRVRRGAVVVGVARRSRAQRALRLLCRHMLSRVWPGDVM